MWQLVLSLFGIDREPFSRIFGDNADPSLWKKGGARGYQLFLWLIQPNSLVPTRIILFTPRFESFSKKLNEVRLFILNFFLLVLGILSNATLGSIYRNSWVTQAFLKESLEFNPRQKIFDCLVPTLVLAPMKADSTTKKQSCKRGTVGAKSASDINRTFALLEGAVGCLRIWDDWFQSVLLGAEVSCLKKTP